LDWPTSTVVASSPFSHTSYTLIPTKIAYHQLYLYMIVMVFTVVVRYKREEVKIQAWENHEKGKAEMEMERMEAGLCGGALYSTCICRYHDDGGGRDAPLLGLHLRAKHAGSYGLGNGRPKMIIERNDSFHPTKIVGESCFVFRLIHSYVFILRDLGERNTVLLGVDWVKSFKSTYEILRENCVLFVYVRKREKEGPIQQDNINGDAGVLIPNLTGKNFYNICMKLDKILNGSSATTSGLWACLTNGEETA
ncbi:hypothetical protein M8C21_001959, partial [Ambrosia artemisiifolia]